MVGVTRRMAYDELGRLISVTGNHGQAVTLAYDANGNLVSRTDALGHTTTWTYDVFNRPVKVTDPMGHATHTSYDNADRVTAVTDPLGHVTHYMWNGLGELLSLNSPDTGLTTSAYDAYGRRTSTTQADGTVTAYTYDALGRVTQVSAHKGGFGPAKLRQYTYDTCTYGIGHLCAITDPSGSTHYTYTLYGKLASQKQDIDGSVDGHHIFTTTWSYTDAGKIRQIGYPGGLKVRYTWNAGHIASLDAWLNGTWKDVAHLGYAPGGALNSIYYGNGLSQSRVHDTDGRTISITTGTLQNLAFTYDTANHITAIDSTGAGNDWNRGYSYDADGRLAGVMPWLQGLSYDANGNRTARTMMFAGTENYSLLSGSSNILHSITGARTRTFQHDAVGRRTAATHAGVTTNYTYGAFGRLTQASRPASTSVCGMSGDFCAALPGGTWNYLTNALGQRVLKRPLGQGAIRYTFTPGGTLLSETRLGTLSPAKQYIWAGGLPVAFVWQGQLYYVSTDQVGRPELVTNSAGSRVWQAQNIPFDRRVLVNGIDGLNLGFPGQYYDASLGLWYNAHRYYDAKIGRYTTPDPLGLAAGVNAYAYAGGNPLSLIDTLGLQCASILPMGVPGSAAVAAAISLGEAAASSIEHSLAHFLSGHVGDTLSFTAGEFFGGQGDVSVIATSQGLKLEGHVGAGLVYGEGVEAVTDYSVGHAQGFGITAAIAGGIYGAGRASASLTQGGFAASAGMGTGEALGGGITLGYYGEIATIPYPSVAPKAAAASSGCACSK